MTKSDYRYLYKAGQLAQLSDYHKAPTGCIAVYHGNIIATGYNCNKTHPTQKLYNRFREQQNTLPPKLHAEISCINSMKNLNIDFSKVKLYIYRIRRDQPFGLSRPCPSCMAAIKDLGIRDIYYTTNEGCTHERIKKCNIGGII